MINESKLQSACVRWFRYQYPKFSGLLVAIPNGAVLYGSKLQRIKQWQRLKAEGAQKGAADLFLVVARGGFHGLFIEMKTTRKGSRQSPEQREFEAAVTEQGFKYVVPRTFKEFEEEVNSYLSSDLPF